LVSALVLTFSPSQPLMRNSAISMFSEILQDHETMKINWTKLESDQIIKPRRRKRGQIVLQGDTSLRVIARARIDHRGRSKSIVSRSEFPRHSKKAEPDRPLIGRNFLIKDINLANRRTKL
jgi:hypothetical protein